MSKQLQDIDLSIAEYEIAVTLDQTLERPDPNGKVILAVMKLIRDVYWRLERLEQIARNNSPDK